MISFSSSFNISEQANKSPKHNHKVNKFLSLFDILTSVERFEPNVKMDRKKTTDRQLLSNISFLYEVNLYSLDNMAVTLHLAVCEPLKSCYFPGSLFIV